MAALAASVAPHGGMRRELLPPETMMSSKVFRIETAAIIGFAVGLLIATAESLFVHSPAGMYYTYGLMLVWPARLLIPSALTSPVATSIAIVGNALLYAAAAAVADRIYAGKNSPRVMP